VRETQGCKSCTRCDTRSDRCRANFLSAVVLNNLRKFFIPVPCLLQERLRDNMRNARLSPLHHETLYDTSDAGCSRRGATNLQKSYKSLLYTCTLSDSQSGISRNFLQTSANHSRPLPSWPSVTKILLRRDEFQRRHWGK